MKAAAIITLLLTVAACGAANEAQLRSGLKSVLKDPSSAEFRNEFVHQTSGHLCGEVNAKNSFGAYVGFRRFVSGPAQVAIEGAPAFQGAWGALCS